MLKSFWGKILYIFLQFSRYSTLILFILYWLTGNHRIGTFPFVCCCCMHYRTKNPIINVCLSIFIFYETYLCQLADSECHISTSNLFTRHIYYKIYVPKKQYDSNISDRAVNHTVILEYFNIKEEALSNFAFQSF